MGCESEGVVLSIDLLTSGNTIYKLMEMVALSLILGMQLHRHYECLPSIL